VKRGEKQHLRVILSLQQLNVLWLFVSFDRSHLNIMKRSLRYLLLILLMSSGISVLQGQTTYTLNFPNPNSHYIKVDVTFRDVGRDYVDIKMPVWTPGSYLVREYSKNVEGFVAYNVSGVQLRVEKVRKNVWRVYHGISKSINCTYWVYANELNIRSCFVDDEQGYINGVGVFMYADTLRSKPYNVLIRPPSQWTTISTGLSQILDDSWARTAIDYNELVDAPIIMGKHKTFTFDYHGIPHQVAMIGEAKYDSIKIKNDFYKIVEQCTKIFGENPNKNYTFIIHNSLAGGGGLEHHNSCSIMTARTSYDTEKGYKSFLSLVAHEYLHLWMGKRIRSMELGPFDYENEVYTRQLWFFEGFTSFYDDYLVYRAGFYTEAEYLETVKSNIQNMLNTPGDKVQSVSEASFDAWIKYYRKNENTKNSQVSYYTKGAAVATVLNLDFLNTTGGKQSLDTLLNVLYNQHYKTVNRGLTDSELQDFIENIGEQDYDNFFAWYINGTHELPVEEYLLMAGMTLKRVDGMKQPAGYLGATMNLTGNKLVVTEIERESPAWTTGLSANDEITSIDNQNPEKVANYLAGKAPGTTVKIKFIRAGLPKEISITLGEPVAKEFVLENVLKPTEMQLKVRKAWLGK